MASVIDENQSECGSKIGLVFFISCISKCFLSGIVGDPVDLSLFLFSGPDYGKSEGDGLRLVRPDVLGQEIKGKE